MTGRICVVPPLKCISCQTSQKAVLGWHVIGWPHQQIFGLAGVWSRFVGPGILQVMTVDASQSRGRLISPLQDHILSSEGSTPRRCPCGQPLEPCFHNPRGQLAPPHLKDRCLGEVQLLQMIRYCYVLTPPPPAEENRDFASFAWQGPTNIAVIDRRPNQI